MAKKLPWGTFTHEDLLVDREDDIYLNFLFARLKDNGFGMEKARNFKRSLNNVRGTETTCESKKVGLQGSFVYGWDRTSWYIPYMRVGDFKEAFDRRHTLDVLTNKTFSPLDIAVPDAEYVRVYPETEPTFNLFLDTSIITMLSMWGNVYGPIPDDTKDYQFVTACTLILNAELEREGVYDEAEESLTSREFVERLLRYMGCHDRYNNNDITIKNIVTRIIKAVEGEDEIVPQLTVNNNQSDYDVWMEQSPDWGAHNTEDDDYFYIHVPLQDNDSFCWTYAERVLTTTCKKELDGKKVKVMLYNQGCATNSVRIVKSRNKFIKRLNSSWYIRRNNVLSKILKMFNFEIPSKTLDDLPLEVWCFHQLQTESEPWQMVIDEGEPN